MKLWMIGYMAKSRFAGNGTQASPWEIWDIGDLILFQSVINNNTSPYRGINVHWIVMADINCLGMEWNPVGNSSYPFLGYFNGNGHIISNFVISNLSEYAGLFGVVGEILPVADDLYGHIEKLCTNGTISGSVAGGIAGYLERGTISECYNLSCIYCTTESGYAGGIVGKINRWQCIIDCYNAGSIDGVALSYIGGITNSYMTNELVYVKRCFNVGNIRNGSFDLAKSTDYRRVQPILTIDYANRGGGDNLNVSQYFLNSCIPVDKRDYIFTINRGTQHVPYSLTYTQMTGAVALSNMAMLNYKNHLIISSISNYNSTVPMTIKIKTSNHGIPPGSSVNGRILGTSIYDGIYTMTYISSTEFYIYGLYATSSSGYAAVEMETPLWRTDTSSYPKLIAFD